jgi:hypothetical protein
VSSYDLNLNSGAYQPKLMPPFETAKLDPMPEAEMNKIFLLQCKKFELEPTIEERQRFDAVMEHERHCHVYLNDTYQVQVRQAVQQNLGEDTFFPPMVHLSIKRIDRKPIDENHWRILQEIKNCIIGTNHEAVEIYPNEDRLMDTANQYHLWCLAYPDLLFPFGYMTPRAVTSSDDVEDTNAEQRD